MADKAGDTFVSKGIEYILKPGPKGILRPYTKRPVNYSTWIWFELAVTVVAIGVAWWLYKKKESS